MSDLVRAHVIITGRVQGVFFRLETQHAAESRKVNGWVRNKTDGSVEAVFEGGRDNVDATLSWCRKGPPRSRVDDVKITWQAYTGEFSGFNVSY
jgi:acylphosphatase